MNSELNERLEKLNKYLSIEDKRKRISELKKELENENTWNDWEKGKSVSQELSALEKDIYDYEMLELYIE